jgi:predicted kinase
MATLHIVIGCPGSGKSTFCKKVLLPILDNSLYLSTDEIREEITGSAEDQSRNDDVFRVLYERMEWGLARDKNVIVDATNIRKSWREPLIKIGKKHNAKIYAYVIKKSLEECVKNNNKRDRKVPVDVIEDFFNNFEHPTRDEGIDVIFEIKEF